MLLLVFCVAALAGIALLRMRQDAVTLLGARLADAEQLASITALPQTSAEGCVLHWNGEVLPYDSARGVYCLPQPLDGSATGSLSTTWGRVYLPADQWAQGRQDAMAEGRTLEVYVSDGKRWCRLEVYLSGVPALVVHTQRSVPYKLDPQYVSGTMASLDLAFNYGEYTLFWPEGNSRSQTVTGNIEYHWRGNTNLLANKKSYRLNLLDAKGQPDAKDLLGLGEDADWFLLNFATDTTRARDKVAWQLWQQMAQQNDHDLPGIQVEYVELYLDDTYVGLYGIARPISRDSLQLSANDLLYKWRTMPMDRSMPTAETFDTVEGWTTPNVLEIVTDPASGSYVIKAQGQGFGGMVPVIVAFGSDGNIIAVKFLENSETKGYGSRLYEQPEWASQFTGMPAENFAISDIDALSGATMSTKGAVAGINAAIDGFNEVKGAA